MNQPPARVLERIEEVKTNYERSRQRNISYDEGPLTGFLWQDRENTAGYIDVMYVTERYLEQTENVPNREWPGYEYYSLDGIATEHTPW